MANHIHRPPYYAGTEFADLSKHDGGLLHAVGASNYQVLRANRSRPEEADGFGNTYNHAPMLTYWRGCFYLEYLSNPVSEHTGAGQSFIVKSKDGMTWDKPRVSFPVIRVPAGEYQCADGTTVEVPEGTFAFMHQRMGFYHTKDDRLIVSGFYGHAPHHDICPWRNYGIGRVVREVFEDGAMGPVYFIRYLDYSGWTEDKLPFPYYKHAADKSFVAACEELLADRFVTEQWTEEHGPADTAIGLKIPKKEDGEGGTAPNTPFESASSFCWYHIDENTVAALWKQGKVGISRDGGVNWDIRYEPTFATSGAKSWGQKTEDGRFAICYDNSLSSEHRYPLVVVTSDDGIEFNDMACVFGELPPRRYEGIYKDFGPQYIRGICEGHKEYPAGAMWICHSINKEDIGVSRIPLPVRRSVDEHIHDTFEGCEDGYVKDWNIYSTKWSPVTLEKVNGETCLKIADQDPCDYARAMRIFPRSAKVSVVLEIMAARYEKDLEIELADKTGVPVCRVSLGGGWLKARYGSNTEKCCKVEPEPVWHTLEIRADCANNVYTVLWDSKVAKRYGFGRPVHKANDVERLILRTKPRRCLPNFEIYPDTPDMKNADEPETQRIYLIRSVSTKSLD
ncbi:MAG TPA: hypothetical protein PLD68_03690 [Clostridiales bacterium]|nr:MAG: hypothetical protein BWY37_00886 [Firmicutes bacterium ADurb.Bin262]HOU09793.1 hypothetical protein [Clostridiales bacterium]HQH62204.1 hypothetical protein [Clostridiales bacterium]